MNRKEKLIVFGLVLALVWSFYNNYQTNKAALEEQAKLAEQVALEEQAAQIEQVALEDQTAQTDSTPQADQEKLTQGDDQGAESEDGDSKNNNDEKKSIDEVITEFNGKNNVKYIFTSKGGAIQSVSLNNYPKENVDGTNNPVVLDFSEKQALVVEFGKDYDKEFDDYDIKVFEDLNKVVATSLNTNGIKVIKTFEIPTNGYDLVTTVCFTNTNDKAVDSLEYDVSLGAMKLIGGDAAAMADIAIDCRSRLSGQNDFDVNVFDISAMAGIFGGSGGGCSAAKVPQNSSLTKSDVIENIDVDWVTVRDRFFVQFLSPTTKNGVATKNGVGAKRFATRQQTPDGMFAPDSAAATILFKTAVPANGTVEQCFSYYVGPRKMSELRDLGEDTIEIMNFGTWELFSEWLLDFLNFLANSIGVGYGMAIILLTIVVRVALHPISKKSVASMRKMQEIQPLIKEINEKYKDDPRQRQQEMMRIYGEHKINPLASCLPMLIQLPIFVALFTILRSAVELRFESFLWIKDLSSEENIGGTGINLLPILMALTMALQTSLTPSTGDRSQRKMMTILMPLMMLFFFYSMPSALTLYWTVSQVLAIIGMLWYNKRHPIATNKDGVEIIAPPRETRQMRRNKK